MIIGKSFFMKKLVKQRKGTIPERTGRSNRAKWNYFNAFVKYKKLVMLTQSV